VTREKHGDQKEEAGVIAALSTAKTLDIVWTALKNPFTGFQRTNQGKS
jgi:hypothetical protein